MRKKGALPDAYWRSAGIGRWRSRKAGYLLILIGILGTSLLTAAMARAGSTTPFQKKGTDMMQQAATAQLRNIPTLDASQAAQVETFTFGLG